MELNQDTRRNGPGSGSFEYYPMDGILNEKDANKALWVDWQTWFVLLYMVFV
jgi:hypothetical protein